ncbi:MAG: DUF4160 domain-containing protein [Candidatus Omnitrophica bacterium]|nr:DUF4160 domain-containing protein [Candidatus Omnitrophota bacterium]
MSPTVFRYKGYRFFFFSLEEERVHIHVSCPSGEAKFWLEPIVALQENYGLSRKELGEVQKVIKERRDEIISTWKKHFKS